MSVSQNLKEKARFEIVKVFFRRKNEHFDDLICKKVQDKD
jgi:hypothetical protein